MSINNTLTTRFQEFIHRETTGGLVLISCTILALYLANSSYSDFYQSLINIPLGFHLGPWSLSQSLQSWINEGLMTFFFLIVGLELKRELLTGDLSDRKAAALPIMGALGGMILPALIYAYFNFNTPYSSGWGIPMATDIAFSIGILALLGKRVPNGLIIFLVALAIADDLGAVLVIALFYTEKLHIIPLLFSGGFIACLFILNLWGVRRSLPYFMTGALLWGAMLESGIHATLAGIFTAAAIPAYPKYNPADYSQFLSTRMNELLISYETESSIIKNEELRSIVGLIEEHTRYVQAPMQRLERYLHLPVTLIIIPLFALFNAGVELPFDSMKELMSFLNHPITYGVGLGLLLGKSIGITSFCWMAIRLKWAQLPENTNYHQLLGVAMIAGVGFTMSLFISDLAFQNHNIEALNLAKMGILLGSLVSGVAGVAYLFFISARPKS